MRRLRSDSNSSQVGRLPEPHRKRKLPPLEQKKTLIKSPESRKIPARAAENVKIPKKEPEELFVTPRRSSRSEKFVKREREDVPSTSTTAEDEEDGVKTRRVQKIKTEVGPRCSLCKCGSVEVDENLFSCRSCNSAYHVMKCLRYAPNFANEIYNSKNWVCARCVRCHSCEQFIGDPSNVECWSCCRAWHGECAPKGHKSSNVFDGPWYCASCSKKSGVSIGSPGKKQVPKKEKKSSECETHEEIKMTSNNVDVDEILMAERRRNWDRVVEAGGWNSPSKSAPTSPVKSTTSKAGKRQLFNEPSSSSRFSYFDSYDDESDHDYYEKQFVTEFDASLYEQVSRSVQKEKRKSEINSVDDDDESDDQWVYMGGEHASKGLYRSAYIEEVRDSPVIHVCKFCFYATNLPSDYRIHCENCTMHFPPGNEIYRDGNLSFFEVDGAAQKLYCRDLCLLAKLFISSKTLYHEVETFIFYILCEITEDGFVMVGYFSKEKNPSKNNNLSCLLTLPTSQRMGYGRFLIDMSYALSRLELKVGSPEHPLSDLGILAYRGYWRSSILCYLRSHRHLHHITIKDISMFTRITPVDVINQLLKDNLLVFKHDVYYIKTGKRAFKQPLSHLRRRAVDMSKLKWLPKKENLKGLDPFRLNFYV